MLCQRCQQRPANVHLKKTINGETNEMYLCNQCAQDTGELSMVFDPGLTIHNLLAGFLQQTFPAMPESPLTPTTEPRCPECGTTYSQFAQSSLLGCPLCYEHLATQLDPVIRRIQSGSQHTGKAPRRAAGGTVRLRRELSQLRTDLQMAILKEDYEGAARLRDRMKELEQKLQAGGEGNAVE